MYSNYSQTFIFLKEQDFCLKLKHSKNTFRQKYLSQKSKLHLKNSSLKIDLSET